MPSVQSAHFHSQADLFRFQPWHIKYRRVGGREIASETLNSPNGHLTVDKKGVYELLDVRGIIYFIHYEQCTEIKFRLQTLIAPGSLSLMLQRTKLTGCGGLLHDFLRRRRLHMIPTTVPIFSEPFVKASLIMLNSICKVCAVCPKNPSTFCSKTI